MLLPLNRRVKLIYVKFLSLQRVKHFINSSQSDILVNEIVQLQSFMAALFPGGDTSSYENMGWFERELSDANFSFDQ